MARHCISDLLGGCRGGGVCTQSLQQGIRVTYFRTKALASVALVAFSVVSASAKGGWSKFADYAGYGLPMVALGLTAADSDLEEGGWQLAYTGLTSSTITYGLKYAVNAKRPNGGNHGFPSGHANAAFFAAGYLEDRYGWEAGLPAHLLATAVAYSRVHTKDHNVGQVLAGAAIGELSAYVFTSRRDDAVRFFPWTDPESGAVGLGMVAKF
jgi:membrane-associated phospholipid phosphatase